MTYKTYQVQSNLSWSCPGALVFVEDDTDLVLAVRANPENTLTESDCGDEKVLFDPSEYTVILEVEEKWPMSVNQFSSVVKAKHAPQDHSRVVNVVKWDV